MELIDTTSSSLTVSWPDIEGAKHYVLEYRRQEEGEEFSILSDSLTSTQAKKKNLQPGQSFTFRVRDAAADNDDYITHDVPFQTLTLEQEKMRLPAPTVQQGGFYHTVLVDWKADDKDAKFELQMRENKSGTPWKTIAGSTSSTQVRKKHLDSEHGYQFRVRPGGGVFSEPSATIVAWGLSKGIQRFMEPVQDLVTKKQNTMTNVSLQDGLGGKEFVLLYASAHWCGPCRQFTPQLSTWYQRAKTIPGTSVEVIFLSCDHDEGGFNQYFQTMPWLAVPYDDDSDGRETLLAKIRVQGIPRLVVLDGQTGRVLVPNAVGQSLDPSHWRRLAQGGTCGGGGGCC